jgi:hypothetical protein
MERVREFLRQTGELAVILAAGDGMQYVSSAVLSSSRHRFRCSFQHG